MKLFSETKKQGNKYEEEWLNYIEYDVAEIYEGYFPEWDIKTTHNDIDTTYEVKSDTWGGRTGNMCVEIESNKKPSGLSLCCADYWINFTILSPTSYIIHKIPLADLREMVSNKEYHTTKYLGNGNNSKCLLFALNKLDKYKVPSKPTR